MWNAFMLPWNADLAEVLLLSCKGARLGCSPCSCLCDLGEVLQVEMQLSRTSSANLLTQGRTEDKPHFT